MALDSKHLYAEIIILNVMLAVYINVQFIDALTKFIVVSDIN